MAFPMISCDYLRICGMQKARQGPWHFPWIGLRHKWILEAHPRLARRSAHFTLIRGYHAADLRNLSAASIHIFMHEFYEFPRLIGTNPKLEVLRVR
jgi:hypothetical protein